MLIRRFALSMVIVLSVVAAPIGPARAQVMNGSFETGDQTGWSGAGNVTVDPSFGTTVPSAGSFMAVVYSDFALAIPDNTLENFLGIAFGTLDGLGNGDAIDGSALHQFFDVNFPENEGPLYYAFDWDFVTDEPTPSVNNDFAVVAIDGVAIELADTGAEFPFFNEFPSRRETGFRTSCFTRLSSGTVDFGVAVLDAGNSATPSWLLVDNLRQVNDTNGNGIPDPCDPCGNGVREGLEECDDGNLDDGDGCSSLCQVESCHDCVGSFGETSICDAVVDGTSCEDGVFCNGAETCQSGVCVPNVNPCLTSERCDEENDACNPNCAPFPVGICRTAQKSILVLKDSPDKPARNKVVWHWTKGQPTDPGDFGDPTDSTQYSLCLYAGPTSALVRQIDVSVGSLWQSVGGKNYKYMDKLGQVDGVTKVLLKGSAANKSKALFKGGGVALPGLPAETLPFDSPDYPVIVELINNETGVCFGSSFDEGDVKKNAADKFKAKADE